MIMNSRSILWSSTAYLCILIPLSVQQLPPMSPTESGSESGAGCSDDEFECLSSGFCLAEAQVCDNVVDCPNGEDESVCLTQSSCYLDQFSCGVGDTCISLRRVCDGIGDCDDRSDEQSCASLPGSLCAANEFSCSLRGICVPLASLCDGVGDCPNGNDESQCEQPEAEVQVPDQIAVMSGEAITLSCDAIGYSPAFVTWRKNLKPISQSPRYNFTSRNGFGVLHISDATLEDAGIYHCEVISTLHGSAVAQSSIQVQVNDASPYVCTNHINQAHVEGSYYYDLRPRGIGPAAEEAADIIFVVDESGSMVFEHQWITDEVKILDRMLQERGVGAGERPNQFALVGFGRNNIDEILGVTLTQLTSADGFIEASSNLMLTGTFEDGYGAIDYAINNIPTRADTAKQIILVTDEDRGVIRRDLTRDIMEGRIREAGFTLNVAVNQAFRTTLSGDTQYPLGVSNGQAYLFSAISDGLFSVLEMETVIPSSNIFYGSTFEDYVVLALRVGGAAWDLNHLREQGESGRAFTSAFSEVKVEEVMTVFRYCFECQCLSSTEVCSLADDVRIQNCVGTSPVLESVVTPQSAFVKRGSTVSFECLSYTNFGNLTVSYEWSYPPQLSGDVMVEDEVLVVSNVGTESEVNFTCIAKLEGTSVVSMSSSTIVIDNRCQLQDWSYLILGGVRQILSPQIGNISRAADIILLVDESGSMSEEHTWIPMMIELLDKALMDVDVGLSTPNRFGVVGFGDDCNEDNALGRVILNSAQQQFSVADNITDFTRNLNVGGRKEDGYSAINVALDGYSFRDVAKQFILITDEDRDVLQENLTRDSIRVLLENAGIRLNSAISEEYEADGSRALGIDSSGNAYVYDPSIRSSFRVIEGSGVPVQDSAYGSTNTDYTQLALELEGAAWDLSQLRQGGGVAEGFTNAFVQVKVLEIQSQLSRCMNCTCGVDGPICNILPNANFSVCMGIPDPPRPGEVPLSVEIEGTAEVSLLPSQTRSFTCRVNSSAVIRWTFNGGNLPSNVQMNGTGGHTSILTIVSASSSNEGIYACLVHSQSSAFRDSSEIRVLFYDPAQDLMLMLSPLQPIVTRGRNTTLSCSVESPSEIRWTFNDGILPANSLVTMDSISSELMLTFAEEENSGEYTCIANNTERNVVNKDTAYVEVVGPILKLLINPDILTVDENMPAELKCQLDCFCPGVIPVWSRSDNASLSDQVLIINNEDDVVQAGVGIESVLLIPVSSPSDSGRYICSAELDGNTITKEAYLTVIEGESFEAVIIGPLQVDIQNGNSHSIVCESNQNSSSIIWMFNGTTVQVQGSDPIDATEEFAPVNVVAIDVSKLRSVLTIIEADTLNAGTYQCVATSEASNEIIILSIDISISN